MTFVCRDAAPTAASSVELATLGPAQEPLYYNALNTRPRRRRIQSIPRVQGDANTSRVILMRLILRSFRSAFV